VAFTELELARVRRAVGTFLDKRRPPPHLRAQLDFELRIAGQSVEILEVRPAYLGRPGEFTEHGVAKSTYVRTRRVWRVFWMRRDLKWHRYDPAPEVDAIDAFCAVVDEDAFGCFFG
jgi:hypothetical protein